MKTTGWYAWVDQMPPEPDDLRIFGEVCVVNPGIQALLYSREPQGINPNILLLDLYLFQQPGQWPEVATWVQARYDKVLPPNDPRYTSVEIFHDGASIARIKVDVVH